MSGLFQPVAAKQLYEWVFSELDTRDSVFGIPRRHFFQPEADAPLRKTVYGHRLETPFGPAAGPHTQMAQNIVASWLCGARYIELKTVQTLDALNVPKPCIDMADEGYNVEWSQELSIRQSFDEYLRAWVLIHALHRKLGFPGDSPGMLFNISVGYDLEGIRKPNMQWFLEQVSDCSAYKRAHVEQIARHYPQVRELPIPDRLSDNVTLSTMHGCPPGEIESIGAYLLRERRLHTLVKCNPTLLGPERVRALLQGLKYRDVNVPDAAFDHDLGFCDAVPMLNRLRDIAADCGLDFGVKLSNTLEVENFRPTFDDSEKTAYLSGRPLHAITIELAHRLSEQFDGDLPMSFSAGANCFNASALLAVGMQTVTVCSDLLKTGGYLRLLQYIEKTEQALRRAGADSIEAFILRSTGTHTTDLRSAALTNLHHYARQTRNHSLYRKDAFDTSQTKAARELGLFDCIRAPCMDRCALNQDVPGYLDRVRKGKLAQAERIIRRDNPLPCTLGRICDHLCEQACVRNHLDQPVAIRDVKRFVMDHAARSGTAQAEPGGEAATGPVRATRVAVIGAGPGGLAAAFELARGGCAVEIFEHHDYVGGMAGGVVPEYRLPRAVFEQDFSALADLGIELHLGMKAGRDFHLSQLRRDGFDAIVLAVGAQRSKTLGLEHEDCDGVIDALQFLRRSRAGTGNDIGKRVGVIGAGDTAMDCARVAWRSSGDAQVKLIYRRTVDQMPAEREEIEQLIEEGIEVLELASPLRLVAEDGKLRALVCRRMVLTRDRDASGRRIPRGVPASDFEVPLDTLIMAISQYAVLDFFDQEPIAVNDAGYIEVDPVTFATSVPGVYAGGDAVNEGPASIVKAAAAGKAIANSILQRRSPPGRARTALVDTANLLWRRSHRQWRVPAPQTAIEDRRSFDEVVLTYTEPQARKEAARCLDCDSYCSICVGVCPNMALHTYQTEPFDVRLPAARIEDGEIRIDTGGRYRIRQGFQVAVLTDLCNECGNCTTFCPAAGRPFRDKARLYLDRREFNAQHDNAFMVFRDGDRWAMEARWQSATHRIELDGMLEYTSPSLRTVIDPRTFEIVEADAIAETDAASPLSLEPCATMYVLLNGLSQSLPFLPTAPRDDLSCKTPGIPGPAIAMTEQRKE